VTAEPLLVGADIGTTNIKVAAFSPDGRIVAEASSPTPTYFPRPGWAHHDPEELWRCFVAALRKVTGQIEDTNRIASVAIASFSEAAVPLDGHGQPTSDVIAWFDKRTQPQAEWLDREVGKDRLFGLTGLSLQPIFGLCKLLWLKENEPEAFGRTATWLNMADYLAFRLSGVAATDYSLASRTLALDLSGLRWAEDLLQEVSVPPSLFAPLRPSGSALGPVKPEVAAETGLPTSATVAVGGHDHVCGALAVGVVEPGTMLDSLGTTEALFLPVDRPLTDPEVGRQGYTQGAHVTGGYYVLGGQYTVGASIEWFRDTLGSSHDYAALISEAEEVPPGSLGVLFLPHLRLANPPHDDPKSRGAFTGLSTDAKRGTLFRAVLEGLAFESRNSLDPLLEHSNVRRPENIYAIGGVTQNRLLMDIKATILGQEITVFEAREATSLGAAILGGVGAGIYPDIPSALGQVHHAKTVIDPVSDEIRLYDALFHQAYQQVYPALRSLHHTIHSLQANE
jgi:xylulokinase